MANRRVSYNGSYDRNLIDVVGKKIGRVSSVVVRPVSRSQIPLRFFLVIFFFGFSGADVRAFPMCGQLLWLS